MAKQFQPLGPLMSGEGSRAFLGIELDGSEPGKPVVLIFVPDDVVADREAMAALEQETARAANFDHPNIIHVHGLTQTRQGPARVVEYADGESIRRLLEKCKRLPLPIAARVVVDAAMGVHYGHVAGNDDGTPLVHADVRPETLLVSFAGVTKVTGYGALRVAPKERAGHRVKGRRQHCAPEQLVGGRDTVSVQTDVYLLGLLLHELLTGRVPFAEAEDFDAAVLTQPIARIGDLVPAVMEVIEKACAKKAAQRFPTVLAFREALEAATVLATPAEVGAKVSLHFPPDHPAIAARKALLDGARAGLAKPIALPEPTVVPPPPLPVQAPVSAQPLVSAPATTSGQPVVPAQASASSVGARVSASRPAPTPNRAVTPTGETPVQRSRRGLSGPLAIAVLLAAVAATAFFFGRGSSTSSSEPASAVLASDAGTSASDAGTLAVEAPSLDAGTPADAGTLARADAGSSAPIARAPADPTVSSEARAHAAALGVPVSELQRPDGAAPPGPVTLALDVEPSVEIEIDGKAVGRSPIKVEVEPGRRLIKLVDREKGINLARAITVGRTGETSQQIYIGRGYVNVTAPDGATVFIDGRPAGPAPLRELGVYEGSHVVLVKVGEATWKQAFSIKKDERVNFDVQTEVQ